MDRYKIPGGVVTAIGGYVRFLDLPVVETWVVVNGDGYRDDEWLPSLPIYQRQFAQETRAFDLTAYCLDSEVQIRCSFGLVVNGKPIFIEAEPDATSRWTIPSRCYGTAPSLFTEAAVALANTLAPRSETEMGVLLPHARVPYDQAWLSARDLGLDYGPSMERPHMKTMVVQTTSPQHWAIRIGYEIVQALVVWDHNGPGIDLIFTGSCNLVPEWYLTDISRLNGKRRDRRTIDFIPDRSDTELDWRALAFAQAYTFGMKLAF